MLIWAVFTLGYILGVVLTIQLFLKKEVDGDEVQQKYFSLEDIKGTKPWDVFREITAVNTKTEMFTESPVKNSLKVSAN